MKAKDPIWIFLYNWTSWRWNQKDCKIWCKMLFYFCESERLSESERLKATLTKINVFKGNFSKTNEGANVHPCNSFVGQMSSHANFHRGPYVLTPLKCCGYTAMFCNTSFPFWFWGQDMGSDCISSWALLIFLAKAIDNRLYMHCSNILYVTGGL